MSTSTALDFTYLYPFQSAVGEFDRGFGLKLATCNADQENPHFFEGKLMQPRCMGDMLLVLNNVVRTHFFLPRPPLMDPVVTSSESMIRFEGFSGCCGVYARVDLLPEAFQADLQNRGTTNVDFNNPMRAALTRLKDKDEAWLSVGQEQVTLSRNNESIVEKKVKLPIRWIKGFSEVQAYQPELKLRLEVSATEARHFIRSIPKGGAPKRPSYVNQLGKALRITQREQKDSIRVSGTNRISILDPLFNSARGLRIWSDDDYGVSAWEVVYDIGKFFLMISPEVYRGFSGEGQVLEKLATGDWESALAKVQAQLTWQSQIDINKISSLTGYDINTIESALAVLGSRGLAGYDVSEGKYFHRILPFDLDKVEELQPRLKNAKKLIEDKKIELLLKIDSENYDFAVKGTDVTHTVRIRPDADKCTCPWYSKYLGQRGPCKHILAAKIFIDNDNCEE
ncbi:MAG: SWIM zinc finger family protein [Cyanobacteriota bacterium]